MPSSNYLGFKQCRPKSFSALDRVRNVDKLVLDAETRCKVRAERLDAVALGRVVAGGDVGNPCFTRKMHGLIGNLTRQIYVSSACHGVLDKILCSAGATRNIADLTIGGSPMTSGVRPGQAAT